MFFAHLQSLSFLKNEDTCDFGQGAVAMHVGMFSGCSIHSLCLTPAACSFSDRFFSCVSPFTSSVTCIQIKDAQIICFEKKGASYGNDNQSKGAHTIDALTTPVVTDC